MMATIKPRPEVIEIFGSPEFYADGWIIKEGRSTTQVIFFVSRDGENREIVRLHIPRAEYDYWRAVYRAQILNEKVQ